MPKKVIHLNDKFYATCPLCGGQEWLLEIDGPGDQWGSIIGTECKYCEWSIEWVRAERVDKEDTDEGD